jgi:hypothetical protein
MSCDGAGLLFVAGNFGGFGGLFRVNPSTRSVALIRDGTDAYLGIASTPGGLIHAAMFNSFSPNPPQVLATINPGSRTLSRVGSGQRQVRSLAFRAGRLLGVSSGALVEITLGSGRVTEIRSLNLP